MWSLKHFFCSWNSWFNNNPNHNLSSMCVKIVVGLKSFLSHLMEWFHKWRIFLYQHNDNWHLKTISINIIMIDLNQSKIVVWWLRTRIGEFEMPNCIVLKEDFIVFPRSLHEYKLVKAMVSMFIWINLWLTWSKK